MQGTAAGPLPPSNSNSPKNRKGTARAWWGRGQQELRHRANGSCPSPAAFRFQLLLRQGSDSSPTALLWQQVGCQGRAAQPGRWATRWLGQTEAWGEWGRCESRQRTSGTTGCNMCASWGKAACKFTWGAGETGLLRGSTNSIHVSGRVISTVSDSWERSVLQQPGGWVMPGESPTQHAMHRPHREGRLRGCHSCHGEWRGDQTPLPCKFTARTGGWMVPLTKVFNEWDRI